jgi:hypothetical protein
MSERTKFWLLLVLLVLSVALAFWLNRSYTHFV